MNLGSIEALLVLGLLVCPIISVIAVVDSASRPQWAFEQAGFEKVLWVTLSAVGIVLLWFGVVGAIWYLVAPG